MKRDIRLCTVALTAGLLAFVALPAFPQERPSPSPGSGGGGFPAPPSSGGGGSSSSGSSGGTSGGGSSTSSSGGSSMGSSGGGGGDHAVSRGGGEGRRGGGGGDRAVSRTGSPRSVILPSGPNASDPGDRRTPSRGERRAPGSPTDNARPRGDRPATGTAVDRPPLDITNLPPGAWYPGNGQGYWYPCYGYWGTCYYDPFWWDYYYGYAPGYYGDYYPPQADDYDTGSLKLKVKPNKAQVYVDGYFSGIVDDYDGTFQRLKLRPGAHRIELRAEGFESALFDVLIVAGETVTYRAELKPR